MAGPRLTLAAALTLLLSAFSGCGLTDAPRAERADPAAGASATAGSTGPSAPSEPSGSAPTTGPARSTAAVRKAVRRLVGAGTGRVTSTVTVGSNRVVDESVFDVARGYEFRRQLFSADGLLRLEGVVLGNDLWYQLLEPRSMACWVHTTPDVLAGFSTRPAAWGAAAARPLVPPGLNIVATLKGTGGPDELDYHPSSTRLSPVVELLGAPVLQEIGLEHSDRTRVLARTRILDGRLVTIQIEGDELAEAFDEAGAEISSAEASSMRALVSFSLAGTTVDLTPPPPDAVVELTLSEEEFEADLGACERRQR